jgi:PAS domain S-box-containing protein
MAGARSLETQNRLRRRRAPMATVLRGRLAEVHAEAQRLARGRPASVAILQQLIDSVPFAALVADNEGRYVATNRAASTLTGYNPEELRHMSVWELTPQQNDREAELLWRAFLERHEQSGEYALVAKDGHVVSTAYAARTNVLPGLHISLLTPL